MLLLSWLQRIGRRDWLKWLLILAVVLGVGFRWVNLDRKVVWHDEVYTAMRASGYTRLEIDQALFQNQWVAAPDLLKYQQIKPGSTFRETIASLAQEDPQHPPLYFGLARLWKHIFGSSPISARSLPVLLSLLSLPLIYGLAWELWASPLIAGLATALLALSPFDVLFAQTDRQYSLLMVAVVGSSYCLLRALRTSALSAWAGYCFMGTVGLYAHPFFALTFLAQSVYLGLRAYLERKWQRLIKFGISLAISLVLFSPWAWIISTNSGRALATTDWARIHVGGLYLAKLWLLSFTSLFFDLDFGFDNIWTYVPRLLIIGLVLWGVFRMSRQTSPTVWVFVLTTILVPFLALALPDLLLGGKRSAVSRYLISCYPGIQLTMAYLVGVGLQQGKAFWRGLLAVLLTGSLVSCGVSALADTWWNRDLSYFNATVAQLINARSHPVVMTDIGDDFTNTGDLISLSYRLKPEVQFFLVKQDSPHLPNQAPLLIWRPSGKLIQFVQAQGKTLKPLDLPGRLWELD